MHFCRTALIIVVSYLSASLAPKTAAAAESTQASTIQTSAAANSTKFVRITINSSTPRIIQGSVYGVGASIENVSDAPILLDLKSIALAVKPELGPPGKSCTWYYSAGYNTFLKTPLKLMPGDGTTVSFDLGQKTLPLALGTEDLCEAGFGTSLLRSIDFAPGPYSFELTGNFQSPKSRTVTVKRTPSKPGQPVPSPEMDDHYFNAQATMQVGMDQLQTVLYAGLGGIFALLVTVFRGYQDTGTGSKIPGAADPQRSTILSSWLGIPLSYLARTLGAFFLSAAVTVVASRLSTTQFPIKVSVDDFWGALTVGFVSFFIGGKFIDKLSDPVTKPPQIAATDSPRSPGTLHPPPESLP